MIWMHSLAMKKLQNLKYADFGQITLLLTEFLVFNAFFLLLKQIKSQNEQASLSWKVFLYVHTKFWPIPSKFQNGQITFPEG